MSEKIPYNVQMPFALAAGKDEEAGKIMAQVFGEVTGKACGISSEYDRSDLPFVVAGLRAAANVLENVLDDKGKTFANSLLSRTRYVTLDASEMKKQMEDEENGNA